MISGRPLDASVEMLWKLFLGEVKALTQLFGARSFDETRLAVAGGEEGTVVGRPSPNLPSSVPFSVQRGFKNNNNGAELGVFSGLGRVFAV